MELMQKTRINWQVAGAAGEGIKTTGMMLSKTCVRQGLHTFDYTEYPSLIRGGHNTYQVTLGTSKVYSQERQIDLHVALNKNGLLLHQADLTPETYVMYDQADLNTGLAELHITGIPINIPLVELAKNAGAERVMINNVALGASLFLMGLDLEVLNKVISDTFGPKKEAVIALNQNAALAGYNYAKDHYPPLPNMALKPQPQTDDLTLTGNEAISLGLIAGGLKAYVAYPMTPSSSILHTLADWQEKANIFVKHAEDEIGVINMALGMSFAGVRAAVGTSGGGFCYMTEAVGLAGVAELPLVIVESQRPGPALGMPTWTAQPDLLFCIFASQDEFPRIVMAPGDVYEAFELSALSLDLAERYQLPVILMADKHLSESSQSTRFDQTIFSHTQTSLEPQPVLGENGYFPRYKDTPSGLSPRTLPGQANGIYMANSYEHDESGLGSETAADRITQMNKRMRKLELVKQHIPEQYYEEPENPQVTLVGWGSTKYAMVAAAEKLQLEGVHAAVLNLSWLWPFPKEQVEAILRQAPTPILIEGNHTFQLGKLIRQETGIDIYHKRNKFDGRPFYPEEIVIWVKEIIRPEAK
jgi:2-oxoglutarate/2-oxoacid ferredoxin oxidoreductase subunit alpha